MKIIAVNKKAGFEYFLLEKFEAGIQLYGSEVKSIREGNVNLKDSYVTYYNGEIYIKNMHIATYDKTKDFIPDTKRDRKLLMHRREIDRLLAKIKQKGLTIVPTKLYFKESLVKVEIAIAEGKHLYDKRNSLKEKQQQRDTNRIIKEYNR